MTQMRLGFAEKFGNVGPLAGIDHNAGNPSRYAPHLGRSWQGTPHLGHSQQRRPSFGAIPANVSLTSDILSNICQDCVW